MVVRGAGGSGRGPVDSELLSTRLDTEFPPGRVRLVGVAGLDLLPGKSELRGFLGSLRPGIQPRRRRRGRKASRLLHGSGWFDWPKPPRGVHLSNQCRVS